MWCNKIRSIVTYSILCLLILTANNNIALANKKKQHSSKQTVTTSLSAKTRININTVNVKTLQKVKGISKKKAQAIIDYRNKNGSFKSLKELLKVKCRGIHETWLNKVRKFLTV